jgi:hypothetical protein
MTLSTGQMGNVVLNNCQKDRGETNDGTGDLALARFWALSGNVEKSLYYLNLMRGDSCEAFPICALIQISWHFVAVPSSTPLSTRSRICTSRSRRP